MSRYVFKVPDLGEGTVSSEIVAWRVQVGDLVREDGPLLEMSTEKAVVEVPSPVTGRIVALHGGPGDVVAVGAELVVFETDAEAPVAAPNPATVAASVSRSVPARVVQAARVMASPATRRRAREAGINLTAVAGSGPGGRIERADLEAVLPAAVTAQVGATVASGPAPRSGVEEIKVIGVRRVIAERMAAAKRNIPHFAYVEEVDVTELESLRSFLNGRLPKGAPSYTYLPLMVAALVRVLEAFPQCNAHYDAERNVVLRHRPVHVGIATQTPDGLKVPVVRHAEALTLAGLAAEIRRVSDAARSGRASRAELGGSTITVTSLGKLGGIASTPVINSPEVAIIGVNKAVDRPVVINGQVVVRRMMNLSSSFDHRFVDGFDAAAMVQALKERLEHPAMIFMSE
ncbi:MAG: dihydrolipoamide acetyltransferase family protein [Proteobacteria bacterium]|nr:dihydrolipoamide acetyltransferase family protein [Pseudomonadota bacterium]